VERNRIHGIPSTCGEGNSCYLSHWGIMLPDKENQEMRARLGKRESGKTKALI